MFPFSSAKRTRERLKSLGAGFVMGTWKLITRKRQFYDCFASNISNSVISLGPDKPLLGIAGQLRKGGNG